MVTLVDWRSKVVDYPADVVQGYRRAGYWGVRSIGDEFRAVAARRGLADAVVTSERRVTYTELDQRSDAIAAVLVAAGLRPGDRVVLQLGNTAETVEVLYGLLKAGIVPVCTLVQHGHHEIDAIATMVGARGHLVQADAPDRDLVRFAHEVRATVSSVELVLCIRGDGTRDAVRVDQGGADLGIPDKGGVGVDPHLDPDDVAVMQLSGGTTGTPKVIPRRHAEYWYNGRATAERWRIAVDERVAHFLPIVHNAGIHGALFAAHSAGATLVLGSAWSPSAVLETLAAERVTSMLLITGLITAIADDPSFVGATRHLKRLSLCGAFVPHALFDRLMSMGVPVFQNFGMSEGFCTAMPPDASREMRRETVGFPLSAADDVRVLDPGSEDRVAPGDPGELCVRGPYTVRGYFDATEHNSRVFTEDGFYRTGDVMSEVEVEGRRCYRVEGRIKDLVNRGGEKINAEELESLLSTHPAVREAAVVAMPDERLGERACAFLVTHRQGGLALAEIRAFLSERGVAKYKWPERIEVIDALPLTAVGKVAKRELREQVADRCAPKARQR